MEMFIVYNCVKMLVWGLPLCILGSAQCRCVYQNASSISCMYPTTAVSLIQFKFYAKYNSVCTMFGVTAPLWPRDLFDGPRRLCRAFSTTIPVDFVECIKYVRRRVYRCCVFFSSLSALFAVCLLSLSCQ